MSSILPEWASQQSVGHLATLDGTRPHLVPVVFCEFDGAICIPIDGKPKSGRPLKRVVNIERNPAVSLLIDEYSDDWTKLRWVRFDGAGTLVDTSTALAAALRSKYPQYEHVELGRQAIRIAVHQARSWIAAKDRWS